MRPTHPERLGHLRPDPPGPPGRGDRRPDPPRPRGAVRGHRRGGAGAVARRTGVRTAARALADGAVAHRGGGRLAGRGGAAARPHAERCLRARLPGQGATPPGLPAGTPDRCGRRRVLVDDRAAGRPRPRWTVQPGGRPGRGAPARLRALPGALRGTGRGQRRLPRDPGAARAGRFRGGVPGVRWQGFPGWLRRLGRGPAGAAHPARPGRCRRWRGRGGRRGRRDRADRRLHLAAAPPAGGSAARIRAGHRSAARSASGGAAGRSARRSARRSAGGASTRHDAGTHAAGLADAHAAEVRGRAGGGPGRCAGPRPARGARLHGQEPERRWRHRRFGGREAARPAQPVRQGWRRVAAARSRDSPVRGGRRPSAQAPVRSARL